MAPSVPLPRPAQTRASVHGPQVRALDGGAEEATREEEVAFPAGEEEGARAGQLSWPALSTDDEQRRKAPERRIASVNSFVRARARAGAREGKL